MPKYYVRLEPGGAKDVDGEWLPDPEAAKKLIEAMAADLTQNGEADLPYRRIVIRDESGAIVAEKPLLRRSG